MERRFYCEVRWELARCRADVPRFQGRRCSQSVAKLGYCSLVIYFLLLLRGVMLPCQSYIRGSVAWTFFLLNVIVVSLLAC